jgi:hypothetical protein
LCARCQGRPVNLSQVRRNMLTYTYDIVVDRRRRSGYGELACPREAARVCYH